MYTGEHLAQREVHTDRQKVRESETERHIDRGEWIRKYWQILLR